MTAKANSLFGRYRNWRRYRSTVRELARLSTRELDDIGLAPYQIEDAARGKFRR